MEKGVRQKLPAHEEKWGKNHRYNYLFPFFSCLPVRDLQEVVARMEGKIYRKGLDEEWLDME